jgi:putative DNA primase/helicase
MPRGGSVADASTGWRDEADGGRMISQPEIEIPLDPETEASYAAMAEFDDYRRACGGDNGSSLGVGPILQCLADVATLHVKWMWKYRIPRGCVTLVAGRPGDGKTFLVCGWFAARVSRGGTFPDGTSCERCKVLIISGEDHPSLLKERFVANGGDPSMVLLFSMKRVISGSGKPCEVLWTMDDVHTLENILLDNPDIGLVIVDPVGSFIGGKIDTDKDNRVRSVLAPMAKLAEKYGFALVIIAHHRKAASAHADDLPMGSVAFTGLARCVLHVGRDPHNRQRRLFLSGKNNLCAETSGLAFTIGGDPPIVVFEDEPVEMLADEALAMSGDDAPGRPPTEREAAEEWLRAELADLEEHYVTSLQADAMSAGLNWRTVRRASAEIGVIRHRARFGSGFTWRLPKPAGQSIGQNGQIGKTPQKTTDSAGHNPLSGQNYSHGPNGGNA